MGILFVVLNAVAAGAQNAFNKSYQTNVKMTKVSYSLYLLVFSAVSVLMYSAMAGFRIRPDRTMFLYSLFACVNTIVGLLATLLCMANMNLAVMTVSQNAGTLVLPMVFGALFLNESITPAKIIGALLVILAFLVSFLASYSRTKGVQKSNAVGAVACCVAFLSSGFGSIIRKAFAVCESAASNETFLCWYVIFVFVIVGIYVLSLRIKEKKTFAELTEGIQMRYYGNAAISTACCCLALVCAMQALMRLDVTVFSPVYSSLYMIFMTLVSKFVFKEKILPANYVSVAIGIAAVFVFVI